MADQDYVLIASPIEDLDLEHQTNLLTLGIVSLVTIILGGLFITFMIRRDMRSVIRTLELSADQERETRQSMQNFMGDASHELRTPLTVIKGYAELLAGSAETDPAQRQKAYKRIGEQVDRMDQTISSLLQLAEVGSISANSFVAVDLQHLVSEAAADLKAMDPDRKIDVSLEAVTVKGSAELLARLLNNAIGNIHRHTPANASVRFMLKSAGRSARLTIDDGGPGLPDSAYQTGIQGFRRFDESRSRETGGTGLGMTIMNSIVQAHSGALELAPSDLGGLKLEITLPLN
jgi:signal transduction histidine kinase